MKEKNSFRIYVYSAYLPDWHTARGGYLDWLSKDEHERASRLLSTRKQESFQTSRVILRGLLSLFIRMPPEQIQIKIDIHGKPYLDSHPLEFNISHSEDLFLGGFSTGTPLGIDIQHKYPLANLKAAAQKVLTPSQLKNLSQLDQSDQMDYFWRCWVRKEAVLKARGTGFRTEHSQGYCSKRVNQLPGVRPLVYQELTIDPHYQAGLASWKAADRIQVQELQPKQLFPYTVDCHNQGSLI